MKRTLVLATFLAAVWSMLPAALLAAEPFNIDLIRRPGPLGFLEPIPVHITGLAGEADAVLKNDLTFMGVVHKPLEDAKFLINASATSGRAEARVLEKTTKGQLHEAAFTALTQRAAVHALADSIAKFLTGLPNIGIAQTKATFKVEPSRGRSEVYIADYDGFGAQAVTQDNTIVSAPCWAGRGMLVYSSYKLGNPYIFSHVLGSGVRNAVAKHPGNNYSPAVSADGRRIAMILNMNGTPNLYVANIDGTALKQLTRNRYGDACPCWSPDGQTICYVSRAGGAPSLYKISASGGSPAPLRTTFAPSPTEPDWSPDGKWIALTAQVRGFTLFIVPAAGGEAIELVPGEDPSWAPNSRALMFSRGPDHSKQLYLLDVPTKTFKPLARIFESNSQPSWAK
jgi:TolB protein